MRKILLLLVCSILTVSTIAVAKKNAAGGFTGPGVEIISVSDALGKSDDTYVVLKGNIQQSLGDDIYVFTDGTGIINVEIDEDDWNGLNVSPNDVIIIKGEVDKGWNSIEIDVDEVQMAK